MLKKLLTQAIFYTLSLVAALSIPFSSASDGGDLLIDEVEVAANPSSSEGDLAIEGSGVYLSDTGVIGGQTVRIYATVKNLSDNDLLGTVQFKNLSSNAVIASEQSVAVLAGSTDTVFVDWETTSGDHLISVTVTPQNTEGDDASNNTFVFNVFVDYDFDGDLIGNKKDSDDDNDGVLDWEDAFPYSSAEWSDPDEDRIGNNADPDDDNDGIQDPEDAFPEDSAEFEDTDDDEIGDNTDSDDDNDGLSDEVELSSTDPKNPDTDGDAYLDGPGVAEGASDGGGGGGGGLYTPDAFPNDSTEWLDTDQDGQGNNRDQDDDGDKIRDIKDTHPENHGPIIRVKETVQESEEEASETVLIFDASESYDPDAAESEELFYRWFNQKGDLLSEEAVLRIPVEDESSLDMLIVTDAAGEERIFKFREIPLGFALLGILVLFLGFAISVYRPSSPRQ